MKANATGKRGEASLAPNHCGLSVHAHAVWRGYNLISIRRDSQCQPQIATKTLVRRARTDIETVLFSRIVLQNKFSRVVINKLLAQPDLICNRKQPRNRAITDRQPALWQPKTWLIPHGLIHGPSSTQSMRKETLASSASPAPGISPHHIVCFFSFLS